MDMTSRLTAGAVQVDVALGRSRENIAQAIQGIEALAGQGSCLAVLPEMVSCGFDNERLKEHARESGSIIETLQETALKNRIMIAGSLPESVDGSIFNTLYLIGQDGKITGYYRKTHLFRLTGEHHYYTAGDQITVVDTPVGLVGLMICYDLRFPELCRRLTDLGARMVLVSAQWPTPRVEHWQVLARARAIENQVFMICCNRSGSDPELDFPGSSMIVDPLGQVLAQGGPEDRWISADIDFSVISSARTQIPVLTDRRKDLYG